MNTIDRYGYYAEDDTIYITHIGLFDRYMGVDEDMLPYINGVLSDGPHEDYYVGIADSTEEGEPHVDGYESPQAFSQQYQILCCYCNTCRI